MTTTLLLSIDHVTFTKTILDSAVQKDEGGAARVGARQQRNGLPPLDRISSAFLNEKDNEGILT